MKFISILVVILGLAVPTLARPTASELKTIGLSENPSREEIRYRSILSMPHFLEGGEATSEESEDLLTAIVAYRKGEVKDNRFEPLEEFIKDHPSSTYRLWVEASLAKELYRSGRYSAALANWENAWNRSKEMFAREPRRRAYAGKIGVELGGLYARLGRKEQLAALLSELDKMPLLAPDTEKRQRIRESYSQMGLHPERSFNCGPYAFANALLKAKADPEIIEAIRRTRGDGGGFTLEEMESLVSERKLDWQVGLRSDEGELAFPCVVHWRSDHYAAALQSKGDRVLVVDPTFEVQKWIPKREFFAEASGFFLIPGNVLPPDWRRPTEVEMSEVHGKGAPEAKEDDDDKCPTLCVKEPGMPHYGYDDFLLGVVIADTPLLLESPFGPGLAFSLGYRENSKLRDDPNMPFTNVGTKWSFNYLSFIREDAEEADKFRLYLPGGRQETHVHNGTDFDMNRMSMAQLTEISGGYKRTSNDGAELIYTKLSDDGDRHYLTEIVDPQGNSLTLNYISGPGSVGDRLDYVEDGFGRKLEFKYNESDGYLVSKVVEDIGGTEFREAILGYSNGELSSVTDVEGIPSTFQYLSAVDPSAVTSMTTPYGTTFFETRSFTKPYSGQTLSEFYYTALTITDPEGMQEKLLYGPFFASDEFVELNEAGGMFGSSTVYVGDLSSDEYPSNS